MLKEDLNDQNAPFGVDLLLPQIGAVKHVKKALDAGVDIICAQGGEGGGHTGEIPTSILIPKVVDLVQGATSPLTGGPVRVVAAGGIFDGRGLAMALSLGADAVWVGTRFVASEEAGAPPRHKNGVVGAGYHDTVRTIIFTGRPMRVLKTPYIMDWEENKSDLIKSKTSQGIIPAVEDQAERQKRGEELDLKTQMQMLPLLMGAAAGAIDEVLPAKTIMDNMVRDAVNIFKSNTATIARL